MASIKVRNLDDAVLLRLQSMAQATGSKSLEPYLRKLLTNHSKEGMEESYDEITALRNKVWEHHHPLPTGASAALIRKDRDA